MRYNTDRFERWNMPGSIEDQIDEILGAERDPKPTLLHYFVWAVFGLLGLIFAIMLIFVVFVLLRTALLYGIGSLMGTV